MLESDEPELAIRLSPLNAQTDILKTTAKMIKRAALRPPRTLETTLFDRLERMYGSGIKRMLKVQYRSVVPSRLEDGCLIRNVAAACTPRYANSHRKRFTLRN